MHSGWVLLAFTTVVNSFSPLSTTRSSSTSSLFASRRSVITNSLSAVSSLLVVSLPQRALADDDSSDPPATITPYTRLQARGGDPWIDFVVNRSQKIKQLKESEPDYGIWDFEVRIDNQPITLGDYYDTNKISRPSQLIISNMKQVSEGHGDYGVIRYLCSLRNCTALIFDGCSLLC